MGERKDFCRRKWAALCAGDPVPEIVDGLVQCLAWKRMNGYDKASEKSTRVETIRVSQEVVNWGTFSL